MPRYYYGSGMSFEELESRSNFSDLQTVFEPVFTWQIRQFNAAQLLLSGQTRLAELLLAINNIAKKHMPMVLRSGKGIRGTNHLNEISLWKSMNQTKDWPYLIFKYFLFDKLKVQKTNLKKFLEIFASLSLWLLNRIYLI